MSVAAAPDDPNAPYWQGARSGTLMALCCRACGRLQLPAEARCKHCHRSDLGWEAIRPGGTVRAWCRFHRSYLPQFEAPLPYLVVLVDLDDGLAQYGCMLGTVREPGRLVGSRVRAVAGSGAGQPIIHFQLEGDFPC